MAHAFYVGAYTRSPGSPGITRWQLSPGSAALSQTAVLPWVENPSYLACSEDGKVLFAALESRTMPDAPGGGVASFLCDGDQATLLSIQYTEGALPCHLTMLSDTHKLYAANYGGGSVSVFGIDADYHLSPCLQVVQHQGHGKHPLRQEAPHAHQALFLPADGLLVLDLGLDEGLLYAIQPDGLLGDVRQRLVFPGGSGPRHAALHPAGEALFITCELSNLVVSYHNTPDGWRHVQAISALPEGFHDESYTSAIRVHPDGEHLVVANRGHDSIALFAVSREGEMELLSITPCGGAWPRDCHWVGDFLVCACEHDNRLTTLWLDTRTGHLAPVGDGASVDTPACILPIPV